MDDNEKIITTVWESVRTIANKEAEALGKQVSPAFTASLAEILLSQMGIMASDLEAFASHAKRAGISMEDAKVK
ncbi:uncharacterized protein EV154DRAFT_558163 [Mucor mucedo]|uniref:uncharacterized protein n=1 Tax=Mucor mucedo TaxID=29922 RepID=UPI00221FCAB7|nr:uncharacterized protein EV154DRAFT_558163 [Mucor mucedo]KAI7896541.1 hypothetical protein EV154DRAFT_558163 [Mucor mucedo]